MLLFAYQLRLPVDVAESWIKLTSWAIESVVASGDYVVVDLEEEKNDRVTFIFHCLNHPYHKNECRMNIP